MRLVKQPLSRGAILPEMRGYSVVYHENEVNHCPGCGRTHWYVGRLSAECGFCQTALPLSSATTPGIGCQRPVRRAAA